MNLAASLWTWLTRAVMFGLGVFIIIHQVVDRDHDLWLLATAWLLIGGPLVGVAEAFLGGRLRISLETKNQEEKDDA